MTPAKKYEAVLKALPRKLQEDRYIDFFVQQLSCEEAGLQLVARGYGKKAAKVASLCGFSPLDVLVLQTAVIDLRTQIEAYLAAVSAECDPALHSKH